MTQQLPEEDLIRMYRETIGPLFAYVLRRVGRDRGLAEDLVQETWMRALDAWPRRGVPNEPAAWLMRVARNTLVSHFRRLQPESMDPSSIDLEQERFSPVRNPEVAAVVGWAMARLRRSQADLLEAFYFEEKSVRQIAAEQSLSERAVEGRLRRARAKLKQKLKPVRRAPGAAFAALPGGRTKDARPTRAR